MMSQLKKIKKILTDLLYLLICAEITGDRPRQPAYKIKLMLSRVSWALAHISCFTCNHSLRNSNLYHIHKLKTVQNIV